MDKFAIISLVKNVITLDEIGRPISTATPREVMANINSISAAEFFRAGENGLRAELMFSLWSYEYDEEEEVIYNGKTYSVYRTFVNKDGKTELYCQKKVSNE